ncbi:hypothetical protein Sjap_025252 [Stephania japonica]|uniref:Uncharacterized protein n=1 Tax=Stephania japonica TaxID=461633 RepID=A0AAP0HHS9_9MAGN
MYILIVLINRINNAPRASIQAKNITEKKKKKKNLYLCKIGRNENLVYVLSSYLHNIWRSKVVPATKT